MITPLHSDLIATLAKKPALVFSLDALKGFVLNNMEQANKILANKSITIEGLPNSATPNGIKGIAARFVAISVQPSSFGFKLYENNGEIYIGIIDAFTVTIAIHVEDDPTKVFSHIVLDVSNFKAKLNVVPPNLLVNSPDFEVIGKTIIIGKELRDGLINAPGITYEHLVAIEGSFQIVMPRRIIESAFSAINKFNLMEIFTAFELRGKWNLLLIKDSLIIVPDKGICIRPSIECPASDSLPNFRLDVAGSPTPSPNPPIYLYTWPIVSTGYAPSSLPSRISNTNGFASIYLPKPVLEKRFDDVYPSITYYDQGHGFIGHDLDLVVGLEYVSMTIDSSRFGILLEFKFLPRGYANVTIDVPCVGRSHLADAYFKGQTSSLKAFLSFALTQNSTLEIKSHVEQLDVKPISVTIQGFSRWLSLAGPEAAVAGYILDYILKRIVEVILPVMLHSAIKKEINSKNIRLLDLATLMNFSKHKQFDSVSFSSDSDSILVGLDSNPDVAHITDK